MESIEVNRAGQLAASASLVTDGHLKIMERLELRLQRVNVNVGSRLVRERAEDIDLGYASTSGIAAQGPVGSHSESKIWINGITVGQSAATQRILNIGTWRRTGRRIQAADRNSFCRDCRVG